MKGSFGTSHQARDFAADAISLIRDANIPVVWVLNMKQDGNASQPSFTDVLKLLVHQILQNNLYLHNAWFSAARFQSAQTDSEWFNLSESLLHGLPQIYIIVDVEILDSSFCEVPDWIKEFHNFFEILKEKSIQTTAKVALVSYRTNLLKDCSLDENNIVHLQKTKWQRASEKKTLSTQGRSWRRHRK